MNNIRPSATCEINSLAEDLQIQLYQNLRANELLLS